MQPQRTTVSFRLGLGALTCAAGLTALAAIPGCGQQDPPPTATQHIEHAVVGVWFLQAVGEVPIAIDHTIRLDLDPMGNATYLRATPDPADNQRMTLAYAVEDNRLSIVGRHDAPGTPHVEGGFELTGQTLTIHAEEGDWVLTRAKFPGGELEQARRIEQATSRVQSEIVQAQALAYAVTRYHRLHDAMPTRISQLYEARLVGAQQLVRILEDGTGALPYTFERLEPAHQLAWLDANAGFVLLPSDAPSEGHNPRPVAVVCELPSGPNDAQVAVGYSNGAAFLKPTAAMQPMVETRLGQLPKNWDRYQSPQARAGLEALSD